MLQKQRAPPSSVQDPRDAFVYADFLTTSSMTDISSTPATVNPGSTKALRPTMSAAQPVDWVISGTSSGILSTQQRAPGVTTGDSSTASDLPTRQLMDFLHQQLDSLGVETPILNGLVLLGNGIKERFQGGTIHRVLSCMQCSEDYCGPIV